jgi:hypothetical protein
MADDRFVFAAFRVCRRRGESEGERQEKAMRLKFFFINIVFTPF